jgi:hypothetical protein
MTALRRLGASPGRILLVLLGCELAAALVLAAAGAGERLEACGDPAVQAALAEGLQLTDLTLWSAASYCRHPSQADVFAAHAEHPGAPDHFPAGSMVAPPRVGVGDHSLHPWTVGP